MKKESNSSDFKAELESLAKIEVLENEEMWCSRVIDEYSRKQPGAVIVTQLSLQDDSAKG
jgi:hypothetical protein